MSPGLLLLAVFGVLCLHFITGLDQPMILERHKRNVSKSDSLPRQLDFVNTTTEDFVQLKINKTMSAATAEFWIQSSDKLHQGTPFSYAVLGEPDAFTLTDYNDLKLYINGEVVTLGISLTDGDWHHVVLTWSNARGDWKFYLDGILRDKGSNVSTGKPIPEDGFFVVGQDQDVLGGGFDLLEAFHGSIALLSVRDEEVPLDEINKLRFRYEEERYIQPIAWEAVYTNITGNIGNSPSKFWLSQAAQYQTHFETSQPRDGNLPINYINSFDSVTVSFWMSSSDRNNYGTPFSIADSEQPNMFTFTDYNQLKVYINGEVVNLGRSLNDGDWHHVVFTWSSVNGVWKFYLDGVFGGTGNNISKHTPVPGEGILVVGQEQDSYGGTFDFAEAFLGSLTQLSMWNRELSLQEINERIFSFRDENTTLISWPNVLYSGEKHPLTFCLKLTANYSMEFVNSTTEDFAQWNIYSRLDSISVSFWMKSSDKNHQGTPFSYAVYEKSDVFTVTDYNDLKLYINGEVVTLGISLTDGDWHHVVLTWSNAKGDWKFYLDGILRNKGSNVSTGELILGNGIFIVGQRQVSLAGGFNSVESFHGSLTRLNIWDRVLSDVDVSRLRYSCEIFVGAVIGWPCLENSVRGRVLITPSTFCPGNPTPVHPQSGSVTFKETLLGLEANFECDIGYKLEGNHNLKWLVSGNWDKAIPHCVETYCYLPVLSENTISSPNGTQFLPGTEVTFSCRSGKQLLPKSNRQITCRVGGDWDASEFSWDWDWRSPVVPSCDQVKCGQPPFIANGSPWKRKEEYNVGEIIRYRCNPGYGFLVPNVTHFSTCMPSGKWQGELPLCGLIEWCPNPPLVTHAFFTESTRFINSEVSYSCFLGYRPSFTPTIRCGYDHEWSQLSLKCNAVDCGKPPASTLKIIGDLYRYNASIQYACPDGYIIVGDSKRRCEATGRWGGSAPACQRVPCESAQNMENGWALFQDLSMVQYMCDTGFILRGQPVIMCGRFGRWDTGTDFPFCVLQSCLEQPAIEFGSYTASGELVYNSTLTYTCNTSNLYQGHSLLVCQANGTWSLPPSRCEKIKEAHSKCCNQAAPDNRSWTCPKGWVANDVSEVFSCLRLETESRTFRAAQLHCQGLGGNLVTMRSARKEAFVKSLTNDWIGLSGYWIGLSKIHYEDFLWHDFKDGMIPGSFQDLPPAVRDRNFQYGEMCAYIFSNDLQIDTCDVEYASICETAISCKPGWFGHKCERECHCYGELCDPRLSAGPDSVTCRWGCQRNWMGAACDVKKQDPEVKYFCINSPEKSGKYVHINIYNIYKGLQYRAIYGLSASKVEGAWCNSTTVESRGNSFLAIHIPLDDDSVESMKSGLCVGQQVDTDIFTWIIAIKENRGILKEHDLLVNITCDFSTAENLIRFDSYLLEGDSQQVHTEIVTAESITEDVVLEVINPQGMPVSEAAIGSTILLRMSFGFNKGSLLKGIFPKSCVAFAPGDKNIIKLLDENGCSPQDSPLQPFVLAVNRTLTTPWFDMFTFEDERTVTFQCSFELCFSDDCPVGCRPPSRNRRDILNPTEETPASPTRTIRGLPSISPQHIPEKQDPEVKYYCINSPEKSGKYVHINIYNIYNGLQFRAIYGLSASQVEGAWCNSTTVESQGNSLLTIHIPLDDDSVESMKRGLCVGQQVDTDIFTWFIAIKENRGILKEHDLLVNITCDFSTADNLIRSDSYLLEGETQQVRNEIVTAESITEDVVLEVINPQGMPISEAAIGSTILLQMSFGLNKGSLLKGIFPKSCVAFAPGDKNIIKLLDENGCSPQDSPLQPFVLAVNRTLTTPWFDMFTFEDERTVTFQCSFDLCFSDDCPVVTTTAATTHKTQTQDTGATTRVCSST